MLPLSTCGVSRPAPAALAASSKKVDVKELLQLLLKQRITNMFRRYVPTKLHRLEIALLRYSGREDVLLRSLVAKFGPEPSYSVEQQQLNNALNEALGQAAASKGSRSLAGRNRDDEPSSADHSPRCDTSHQRSDPQQQLRCRTTSPHSMDQFPAAVALVAHLHQLRSRLFEAYTAKRTIIRLQEEKDRDAVARLMQVECRHIMSVISRKQAEAHLMAQKEKSLNAEQQLAQKRQEEMRAVWIQAQANALLQKALVRREEALVEERLERRALGKFFSDELVRIYRTERRMARVRDAAEDDARRGSGDQALRGGAQRSPPSGSCDSDEPQRTSPSDAGFVPLAGASSIAPPAAAAAAAALAAAVATASRRPTRLAEQQAVSSEFALFGNLGTAVSYSVGAELGRETPLLAATPPPTLTAISARRDAPRLELPAIRRNTLNGGVAGAQLTDEDHLTVKRNGGAKKKRHKRQL